MEERRGEVERGDPLALDQRERRPGVPARLRDEAAADHAHRDQRVDRPSCGRAASRRASGRRSGSRAGATWRGPPARSARCERGTPFGRPVVPGRVEHQARSRARRGRARRGDAPAGRRRESPPRRRRREHDARAAVLGLQSVEVGPAQAPAERERDETTARRTTAPPSTGAPSRRRLSRTSGESLAAPEPEVAEPAARRAARSRSSA